MRILLAAASVLLRASLTASGAELAGVQSSKRVEKSGKPLVLNGAGVHSKLIFKVCVAALYVEKPAGAK